jgi:hypothetical protein
MCFTSSLPKRGKVTAKIPFWLALIWRLLNINILISCYFLGLATLLRLISSCSLCFFTKNVGIKFHPQKDLKPFSLVLHVALQNRRSTTVRVEELAYFTQMVFGTTCFENAVWLNQTMAAFHLHSGRHGEEPLCLDLSCVLRCWWFQVVEEQAFVVKCSWMLWGRLQSVFKFLCIC